MAYGQDGYQDDPFTGPFLKALKIQQYLKDQKFQDEQRQMLREQMKMQLDERRRNTLKDDFNTALTLQGIGALPVRPGVEGKFQAGLAGKGTVMAPSGGQYSLPSPEQQAERQGKILGTQKRAQEEAYDPNETINLPPEMGGGTAEVPRTKKAETMLRIYESRFKNDPNIQIGETPANDAGDVTVYAIDKRTGAIKNQTVLKGAGKTARAAGGRPAIANFDAEVKKLMDAWRSGHYSQLGITQEVIDQAQGPGESAGLFGSGGNPAATRIRQAEETLYKRAVDSLENRARGGETGGAQTMTKETGTASTFTPKRWTIKKADVPKAAKLKGMSIAEFKRQATANGGTVIP